MRYTEVMSFELNGVQIKTTLTNDVKVIDEHILSFLQPTDNHRTKVIGFDMEWRPPSMLEPAIFQLCDGNSCLIFHLHPKNPVPLSLRNFLCQPNYTFVGCGIKDNFDYLKKRSGTGCKNAVELGTLAATLMDKPHLGFCGVDELAFVVNKLDLRKYRPLNLTFNWGYYPVSEELAKLATVNVYSYYNIGSALFEREDLRAFGALTKDIYLIPRALAGLEL
ncbi:werner syndrome-like exonuclease-like, partial [Trifolium medium]|nr:werner syndrome-like exonuclease-like [Trifolium medium]